MTKCTACRVRHLTCDQNPVCSECASGNRECIRGYNLRFRHLACPSTKPSRADYSKYEFFFDHGQTWVDIHSEIEFMLEHDDSWNVFSQETRARGSGVTSSINPDQQCNDPAAHPTASEQSSAPAGEPPDLLDECETFSQTPLNKLEVLANLSSVDASLSGETLRTASTIPYPQPPLMAGDMVWPLRNLQEGRLLQHFVTHLAPWVCTPTAPVTNAQLTWRQV